MTIRLRRRFRILQRAVEWRVRSRFMNQTPSLTSCEIQTNLRTKDEQLRYEQFKYTSVARFCLSRYRDGSFTVWSSGDCSILAGVGLSRRIFVGVTPDHALPH